MWRWILNQSETQAAGRPLPEVEENPSVSQLLVVLADANANKPTVGQQPCSSY
jgi:hypothetical protein